MPLERKNIIAKFSEVIDNLTQFPTSYYGGYEQLSLKLQKAESDDLLKSITLTFPPLEGEHASRYGLIISVFWVCVLPPRTPLADYSTKSVETLKRTGRYEEAFGDIRVSLAVIGGEYILKAYTE